jgi:hypothetical protein
MFRFLDNLIGAKKQGSYKAKNGNRCQRRQLRMEGLERREMMSASPLAATVPAYHEAALPKTALVGPSAAGTAVAKAAVAVRSALSAVTTVQSLTMGQVVSASIKSTNTFTFSGHKDEKVMLTFGGNNGLHIQAWIPWKCAGSRFYLSEGRPGYFTLPEAGTYTVHIEPVGAQKTGTFNICVQSVSNPFYAPEIKSGQTLQQQISWAPKSNQIRFYAKTGQSLELTITNLAKTGGPGRFDMTGLLYNISGTSPLNMGFVGSGYTYKTKITSTGWYVLNLFEGDYRDTGAYSVKMQLK